jgi:hypothetical protein
VALAVLGAVAHARSFPTDGLQVVPATVQCVDKGGLMELQLEVELGPPARVDGRYVVRVMRVARSRVSSMACGV